MMAQQPRKHTRVRYDIYRGISQLDMEFCTAGGQQEGRQD